MRGFGAAAVCASAVAAGTIADKSGKPIAAEPPLSSVRRDKCFFVMNISASSRFLGRATHPERHTARDAEDDRLKTIALGGSIRHDAAHNGHVVILEAAAERERHELLGQRLDEQRRVARQRRAQLFGAVHGYARRRYARRVDGHAGVALALPPFADGVEVLKRLAERIDDAVALVARRLRAMQLEALTHGFRYFA